jgi:hypothetical protein
MFPPHYQHNDAFPGSHPLYTGTELNREVNYTQIARACGIEEMVAGDKDALFCRGVRHYSCH